MSLPTAILVFLASVLPVAASICLAILVIHWMRQRQKVQHAGVSVDSPGCAKCLYVARGWDSSACPECGNDVRQGGVVVGTRVSGMFKALTWALVTLAILFPVMLWLQRPLFLRQSELGAWQLDAVGSPPCTVHFRTQCETGFLLPRQQSHTELIIDPANTLDGVLIAGRLGGGWEPPPVVDGGDASGWKIFKYGPNDTAPNAEQIANAIVEATGTAPEATLGKITADIAQQISASRGGSPRVNVIPAGYPNLSWGGGTLLYLWQPAAIASLFVPLLLAALVAWIILRRHKSAWREARQGEWLEAPTLEIPQREAPRVSRFS